MLGRLQGLEVLRIVNEPTAASLPMASRCERMRRSWYLIWVEAPLMYQFWLFGGGVCEVLATSGDTKLGGDNFDKCIVDSRLAFEVLQHFF